MLVCCELNKSHIKCMEIGANLSDFIIYLVPVTITGFPIDDHFYTDLQLNLTRQVEFTSAVDSELTVSVDWMKADSSINSNRVTTLDSEIGSTIFRSSILFSPLATDSDDEGEYICRTSVALSQDNQYLVVPAEVMGSRIVTIEGKIEFYKLLVS